MNKVDSFQKRFSYILDLRGLRQIDITNATGISNPLLKELLLKIIIKAPSMFLFLAKK